MDAEDELDWENEPAEAGMSGAPERWPLHSSSNLSQALALAAHGLPPPVAAAPCAGYAGGQRGRYSEHFKVHGRRALERRNADMKEVGAT